MITKKRKITLDDVVVGQGNGITDIAIIPQAQPMVLLFSDQQQIWESREDEILRRVTDGRNPKASPLDGRLCFLRGYPGQLWIRDTEGSEREIQEIPHAVTFFAWSPNGSQLAAVWTQPAIEAQDGRVPTVLECYQPPVYPKQHLSIYDIRSRQMETVATCQDGHHWTSLAWSPDSGQIALTPMNRLLSYNEALYPIEIVNTTTKEMTYPLGKTRRIIVEAIWSPDGTRIAVCVNQAQNMATTRFVCALLDLEQGTLREFAAEHSACCLQWHPEGHWLYCCADRGITTQIARIHIASGQYEWITDEPGTYNDLVLSPEGNYAACTYRSVDAMRELYLIEARPAGARRRYTNANQALDLFDLSEARLVSWQSADGLEIDGVLYSPFIIDEDTQYPAIVDIHGGPHIDGVNFSATHYWLAAQGYYVFVPDYRSSQRYGLYPVPPPLTPLDYQDIMAGIDWLIATEHVFPDQLGIHGFSMGAALAVWTIGHTSRFRCAIVSGGAYHLEALDGVTSAALGGDSLVSMELGGAPWEVPEAYHTYSPLTYIPHSRTPVLILQGENDAFWQAEILYAWLRRAGVNADLIKYLGEGHVIQAPEHLSDYWLRSLAWFKTHLSDSQS